MYIFLQFYNIEFLNFQLVHKFWWDIFTHGVGNFLFFICGYFKILISKWLISPHLPRPYQSTANIIDALTRGLSAYALLSTYDMHYVSLYPVTCIMYLSTIVTGIRVAMVVHMTVTIKRAATIQLVHNSLEFSQRITLTHVIPWRLHNR